jgi:signal transduction histidine kinase
VANREEVVEERESLKEARAAGLHRPRNLDLSVVDRRRTQLWGTSLFVVAAITVVIAMLAIGPDFLPDSLRLEELSTWVTLVLIGGLAMAFLIYVLEKERSLRRLSRLLFQEQEKIARLEEMDRLKSDFVATVSHELKTPLTAIIGAAKSVGRRSGRMNEEQRARFMEMIERQGTRLLRLVEDVLDTARLESGEPSMRREPVDLKELAEHAIEDLSHTDVGAERPVVLLTDPDRPTAWGDATALQQILGNLLENALKYSNDGSKVVVEIRETSAESVLEVTDEGQGISPEQIQTIFDRFRQADSSAAKGTGGFGLGLYIVKNLVETHRGDVEVESEVGRGSTFRVRLPKRATNRASI